jgi:hypothetical protein
MAGKTATSIIKVETSLNEETIRLLTEIRDRLPAPDQGAAAPLRGSKLADVKRAALMAVLDALDGWIEAVKENHEALGHSGESRGEECWRQFAPDDIRRMVDDAARVIGIEPTWGAPRGAKS